MNLNTITDNLVLLASTTKPEFRNDYRSTIAFLLGIVYNQEKSLLEMDERSGKTISAFIKGGAQKIPIQPILSDAGYRYYRAAKLPFQELCEEIKDETDFERDHMALIIGQAAKHVDETLHVWFMLAAGVIRDDTATAILERCEFYFTHRELGRMAYPQLIPEDS